jgi:hypothetical protein
MTSRLRAALAAAALLVPALTAVAGGPVSAASAAPSEDPNAGAYPTLEAWLDRAPPPDARAGSTIEVGLTIWDSRQAQFIPMGGLYLKLHPATGKARPTEAETLPDWPGHLVANVIVPKGGPGAVELVVRDGPADLPIHVGGVGPPPDAPLSSLVFAAIHLPSGQVIAGRPMDLVVDVRTQADWDPPVSLPDRLVVIATLGRGQELANTEIQRAAGSGSEATFAGPITIPEPGEVTLVVAFPGGQRGADDIIQGATTRVMVGGPGPSAATDATAPAVDAGVEWPIVGGAAALVVIAGFVIRRVFADL